MMRTQTRWIGRSAVSLTLLWSLSGAPGTAAYAQATPATQLTPEQVVTKYLEALKAENFGAAYDQLSPGMVQHKNRDAWTKEQQWSMQMAEAKIFDFHVHPGKTEGDKARVPNVLNSQDKFLNQLGVPEYELYTLIREDGRWKIDQQQLVEKTEQGTWFPPQAAK